MLVLLVIAVLILFAGLFVYHRSRSAYVASDSTESRETRAEDRDEGGRNRGIVLFIVFCLTLCLLLCSLFIPAAVWRAFVHEPLTW